MRTRNVFLAGLLTTCLAPAAALAQSTTVGELVVTATGQSAASSSTKTDTPIIETPQSISIVSREEMDVRAVNTVGDALAYTAGVQAESFGIDSRVDEVSVRGFGAGGFSSNNNFVDGLRLPSGGQWTRPQFESFGIQQVEVLKGPSSVLYGQVAPGGIVNTVSKRPTTAAHGEVQVQGFGYTDLGRWQYQLAGDTGGPIDAEGKVLYRLVALARDGETQIKETSNSRYYVSPSLTFNFTPVTKLTLLGQYQKDEGGSTYQFLPATGTLYPSNGRRIELDAYLGEPDWNTFDRDQWLLAGFLEHAFNDSLKLRTNVRYTHIESLYRVTVLSGDTVTNCTGVAGCIAGQTINRRAVQGVGETDGWAGDVQLEGHVNFAGMEHTLLGGVDYFHTDWEHYRDLVRSNLVLPLLNMYAPVARGSSLYAANMSPQIYTETESKQAAVYAQDQIKVGNWRLAIGGRQDWAKDTAFNPVNRVTTVTEADDFTWRAGAVYLFDNGLAPYASYSQSFQPATGTFFDGRPFDPTTGQQYEAGLRYQRGSNIYLTLAAYQITQQNITTPDPDPTHICGGSTCSVQTGEGRIRGLELEGKASLDFGLTVIGSATATDSEVTKSNTASQRGKALPQSPERMASLFLDYRFPDGALNGVGVGGGARYIGESFGDTANVLAIPDYTLFDLFVRYDFGKRSTTLDGLSASINARNLSNKTYVATCSSTASCFYGSGRTVNVRLQYRW